MQVAEQEALQGMTAPHEYGVQARGHLNVIALLSGL